MMTHLHMRPSEPKSSPKPVSAYCSAPSPTVKTSDSGVEKERRSRSTEPLWPLSSYCEALIERGGGNGVWKVYGPIRPGHFSVMDIIAQNNLLATDDLSPRRHLRAQWKRERKSVILTTNSWNVTGIQSPKPLGFFRPSFVPSRFFYFYFFNSCADNTL